MILGTLNVTENTHRARMREVHYEKEKGARWAANLIKSHGSRWLRPQDRTGEEIIEQIWLEQFEAILPLAAQKWVLKHRPQTLEEAVQVMESFEEVERYGTEGSGQRGEANRGFGPPKGRLGTNNAPPAFTPSGRGRRMEGRTPIPAAESTGPGASSSPRGRSSNSGETFPRSRGPLPQPRREGLRCFQCGGRGILNASVGRDAPP